jgi:N-acetylglucosaminyldiphosphoundecaprenol N-acetyl-beta-D-mannosaminyltransferase
MHDAGNDLERSVGIVSTFGVLGVRVCAVQIPDVVDHIRAWIANRNGCKYVAVTSMHGVTEAQRDPEFKKVLNAADLVVPDGMPLVWLGRAGGYKLGRRVYGPELMETFLAQTGNEFSHFFYGGGPGVPDRLARTLEARHGIRVAGTLSPPFRPLEPAEDDAIIRRINASEPDVLWVGLSTPKQERWMHDHASQLDVPVALGVGAAFDFLTGTKSSPPTWMGEHGLGWLFRLMSEPTRLWRRYLVRGPQFAYWLILDRLGLRDFAS